MHVGKALSIAAFAIALSACALAGRCALAGLDPESNTDGFNPAAEAYRLGEARRLNNIGRQLDTVYRMQWEFPYFPGEPPVRQPIGYESKQVAPNRWIYRPIYADDVAPKAETLPAPEALPVPAKNGAAAKPQAPAPADAVPADLIPPKNAGPRKPAARGPREF
jgi:hypothetical protein